MKSTIELGRLDYEWVYHALLADLYRQEGEAGVNPQLIVRRRADLAKLMFRGLPDLTEVDSSNVAKVGWKEQTLIIQFQNGSTYAYWGVKETIYQALIAAESKGKYVNQVIKADYESLKLEISNE